LGGAPKTLGGAPKVANPNAGESKPDASQQAMTATASDPAPEPEQSAAPDPRSPGKVQMTPDELKKF
jgi:hypothetical protein